MSDRGFRLWKQLGFSLIELMIALTILSLVSAFGMRFLILQHRSVVILEDAAEVQQQLRAAMDLITRELTLVGYGLPEMEPRILQADPERIRFRSNLNGAMAILSSGAERDQQKVFVRYIKKSSHFRKGKTVHICTYARCEWHVLARDSRMASLEFSSGLGGSFPTGSSIQVINQIIYKLSPMGLPNRFKVIRTIDGSGASVAEGFDEMFFQYLDEEGLVGSEPNKTKRIEVRLAAPFPRDPTKRRVMVSQVYLRN